MKQDNGKVARLPEKLRRAVMNVAKALPRVGKGVALGVLLAVATLTLSRCSSPTNGPGTPKTSTITTPIILTLKDSATISINVPASGNLEATMEWLGAYRGQVTGLLLTAVDNDEQYDLDLLNTNDAYKNRALDLTMTTTASDPEDKEITTPNGDKEALAERFKSVLNNRTVNVDTTTNSLNEVPAYTQPPVTIDTFTIGGLTVNNAYTMNGTGAVFTIPNYVKPDSFDPLTVNLQTSNGSLDFTNATLLINKGSYTGDDLSLTHVHYIRQALELHETFSGKTIDIEAGTGANALTPSFKGTNWIKNDGTSPFDVYST